MMADMDGGGGIGRFRRTFTLPRALRIGPEPPPRPYGVMDRTFYRWRISCRHRLHARPAHTERVTVSRLR
jgi:hypothetical protein